jgi:DNA-binding IclR family transcriptional regulator
MKNEKPEAKRKYSAPAVDTAFRILTLLSRKNYNKSKLTEIANALSINPTTCLRILHELEHLSIVSYDSVKKQYTLGPYLVVLGDRAKEHLHYISIIEPYLENITKETGLSSFLVSRVGHNRVTIVSKAESDNFGVKISVGRHFALSDGAYGKCILSFSNENEWEHYLRLNPRFADLADGEIERMKEELRESRENSYAISYNERLKGIFGVSAPIFDFDNQVNKAIAIAGMTAQFKKSELKPIGELLRESANKISEELNSGYKHVIDEE